MKSSSEAVEAAGSGVPCLKQRPTEHAKFCVTQFWRSLLRQSLRLPFATTRFLKGLYGETARLYSLRRTQHTDSKPRVRATAIWPMPLPYPERLVKESLRPPEAQDSQGELADFVNLVVGIFNWLHLRKVGRPSAACFSAELT